MKLLQLVYVCQVDRDLFEGLKTSISEVTLHLANGSYRHVASAHCHNLDDIVNIFCPSAFDSSQKQFKGLSNQVKRLLKSEMYESYESYNAKDYQHPQVIVHSPMRPVSTSDIAILPDFRYGEGICNWFVKTDYGFKLFATSENLDTPYLRWVREHLRQMHYHSMTEAQAYDWEIPLTYQTMNTLVWHPEKLGAKDESRNNHP